MKDREADTSEKDVKASEKPDSEKKTTDKKDGGKEKAAVSESAAEKEKSGNSSIVDKIRSLFGKAKDDVKADAADAKSANSHFLRTSGPHSPDSPGHIKRTVLEISRAERGIRPANQYRALSQKAMPSQSVR